MRIYHALVNEGSTLGFNNMAQMSNQSEEIEFGKSSIEYDSSYEVEMESLVSSREYVNSLEGVCFLGSEQLSSCEEFSKCGSNIVNVNDEEDVENVSLCSSCDQTRFEYVDDQNCWNINTEKDKIHPIIMNVWKNPLFNEFSLESEVVNGNPYWCRSNPLFEDTPDEYMGSVTSGCVMDGIDKRSRLY